MKPAVIALVVFVIVVVVAAIILANLFIAPRSRWWQAYQNRRHSQNPGPGRPKL